METQEARKRGSAKRLSIMVLSVPLCSSPLPFSLSVSCRKAYKLEIFRASSSPSIYHNTPSDDDEIFTECHYARQRTRSPRFLAREIARFFYVAQRIRTIRIRGVTTISAPHSSQLCVVNRDIVVAECIWHYEILLMD